MHIAYRPASEGDFARCTEIRGLTSDNAISRSELAAIGVTPETWKPRLRTGSYTGFVAEADGVVIGFSFGDTGNGEVLVLAVLAGYEGRGIGRELLALITTKLLASGHRELWLAASATPDVRSYGFYRRVGWTPTATYDDNGDEILVYRDR